MEGLIADHDRLRRQVRELQEASPPPPDPPAAAVEPAVLRPVERRADRLKPKPIRNV